MQHLITHLIFNHNITRVYKINERKSKKTYIKIKLIIDYNTILSLIGH